MNQLLECICKTKIIAIVRELEPEYMLGLAKALQDGGIKMIEVTFNQAQPDTWKQTAGSISALCGRFGDSMVVGVGTVISKEQLELAANAGAKYMVSPNVNVEIIRHAKQLGLGAFPGAMTPTEIEAAYEAGADAVKLFPAGTLGPKYVKAVRAPLSQIPLLAVGGVNEKNADAFIAAGCIGIGVGGNLANKEWARSGEWDKITSLAQEFVKAVCKNG